jgi:hypothetical protein
MQKRREAGSPGTLAVRPEPMAGKQAACRDARLALQRQRAGRIDRVRAYI